MGYSVSICSNTPSSTTRNFFSVTVYTSPLEVEKRLQESEKVLNGYNKEVQTLLMTLEEKKDYIRALRVCFLIAKI